MQLLGKIVCEQLATRLSRMASALKKSTCLTGLPVSTNPHHVLGILYGKILRTLQKMPENVAYRKYTEQIIKERALALKSSDIAAVEKQINCGQIEEVIVQAENELLLSRKMLSWKPWEPLLKDAPTGQWTWPPAN